jgi:probable HAF family extracellular repeat protein
MKFMFQIHRRSAGLVQRFAVLKHSSQFQAATCLVVVLVACGCASAQEQAQNSAYQIRYTIQDLGVVGINPGQPFVISNDGWIAGAADVSGAERAILWRLNSTADIGAPGLGGNSIAFGVNDLGVAVGEAENAKGPSTSEDFCGFQSMGFASSSVACVPFIRQNGKLIPLKTLGGVNGVANQINLWGAVAGYAENKTVDPDCPAPQQYQFKPVVWTQGGIQALPTRSDPEGVAFSINDWGQVVGASGTCTAFNPNFLFNLNPVHALFWQNGVAIDMGNLGGEFNNFGHDINNWGQVVGGSDLSGDATSHAFVWSRGSKIQDLGVVSDSVDDDAYSVALGINDEGQIVGLSASADFSIFRAFISQHGKLVDLNSLVTGTTTLDMITACSINSSGVITGLAFDVDTGDMHSYLAVPTLVGPGGSKILGRAVLPEWIRERLRLGGR